jgi:hypothetical protein
VRFFLGPRKNAVINSKMDNKIEKEVLFSRALTVTCFTKIQIGLDKNVVMAYRLRLPYVPVIISNIREYSSSQRIRFEFVAEVKFEFDSTNFRPISKI